MSIDGEFEIAEPRLALAAVARHAGLVIDQRELLPDQPVEQRRFADIGPADDGNREGHERSVRCRARRMNAAILRMISFGNRFNAEIMI